MDTMPPSASTAATAPAASVATCQRKTILFLVMEVKAECDEPMGHEGMHYDSAFGRFWG
jgi:hypothetical protein